MTNDAHMTFCRKFYDNEDANETIKQDNKRVAFEI